MAEPVTLAEARAHLRVIDTSEDGLIGTYISAARRYVEKRSGLILAQRTFTEEHRVAAGYFAPFNRPVVSLGAIAYTDSGGIEQVYAGARLSEGRAFPALNGSWPYPGVGGFRVTYTAGISPAELAADNYSDLKAAVLLMIGHLFANREAVTERPLSEAPLAVNAICDQYRAVF